MTLFHRPPRERVRPPRTAESLRQEAAEHFEWVAQRPSLLHHTEADAQAAGRLGVLLVEAALSVTPEELLDIGTWLNEHAPEDNAKSLAVGALPYLCGQLGLLTMEFVHPAVGDVPIAEVHAMLQSGQPRLFQGVELSADTVVVRYRRTLAGTA